MNVTSIEMYANDKRVFGFDFKTFNGQNPFVIRAATGLDAQDIVPRYYSSGVESATKFYDLALQPREIQMRIGLNPNYKLDNRPADLRDQLMRAIAANRSGEIQLKFLDNNAVVGQIKGFITKFETGLFNKTTDVVLTIYCRDPLIRAEALTTIPITGLDLENLVLTDPISTAPHGFQFVMESTGFTEAFWTLSIREQESNYDWSFDVSVDLSFSEGDELHFSSELNNKYLWQGPGFVTTYLMDKIAQGSVWPIMFPGENTYFIEIAGFTYEWDSISYYETHWGI